MPYHKIVRAGLLASTLLTSAFNISGAHAAAFQLKEDSAYHLGTAFAGSGSTANTPSTVFDNPAGMTELPGLQFQAGASIVIPSFTFKGSATDAFGRPIRGEDNRDGGNVALIPHTFVTYRVAPRVTLGLAVTAPFGLATTYGPNFVGRYHADKSDLKTFNVNPAVAYQVADWLSLGAGFSVQYARAEFTSFLNSSTIGSQALGRPVNLPDGYFRLRGDDFAFGWNVGALLKPGPQTNIGLSYRSRIQQNFEGTADYIVPAPLNLNNRFRNSGGNAKLVIPDTATISITQGVGPNWTVSAEASWTNWSQFKNLTAFRDDGTLLTSTPQRYDNSYFVALGAAYKLNEALTLRAGTAYDKSPVSNAYRTARVPDESRIWIAAGASYKVLPHTTLDFGYAHIFVKDSRLNEVSATGDVLSGRYNSSVDIISFGTRSAF